MKQFFDFTAKMPLEPRSQQEFLQMKDDSPKLGKVYLLSEGWLVLGILLCMYILYEVMNNRVYFVVAVFHPGI